MEYRIKQDWYKEDLWEVFEIDKTNPDSTEGNLIFKGTIEQVVADLKSMREKSTIGFITNRSGERQSR